MYPSTYSQPKWKDIYSYIMNTNKLYEIFKYINLIHQLFQKHLQFVNNYMKTIYILIHQQLGIL